MPVKIPVIQYLIVCIHQQGELKERNIGGFGGGGGVVLSEC